MEVGGSPTGGRRSVVREQSKPKATIMDGKLGLVVLEVLVPAFEHPERVDGIPHCPPLLLGPPLGPNIKPLLGMASIGIPLGIPAPGIMASMANGGITPGKRPLIPRPLGKLLRPGGIIDGPPKCVATCCCNRSRADASPATVGFFAASTFAARPPALLLIGARPAQTPIGTPPPESALHSPGATPASP